MTLLHAVHWATGRCHKKVCQAFSVVCISFSKNLIYQAYAGL